MAAPRRRRRRAGRRPLHAGGRGPRDPRRHAAHRRLRRRPARLPSRRSRSSSATSASRLRRVRHGLVADHDRGDDLRRRADRRRRARVLGARRRGAAPADAQPERAARDGVRGRRGVAVLFAVAAGYDSELVAGTALAGVGLMLLVDPADLRRPAELAELRLGAVTALDLARQLLTRGIADRRRDRGRGPAGVLRAADPGRARRAGRHGAARSAAWSRSARHLDRGRVAATDHARPCPSRSPRRSARSSTASRSS